MKNPIVQEFRRAAVGAYKWTRRHATISNVAGAFGLLAGGLVTLAGGVTFFNQPNYALAAAGGLELTSFFTEASGSDRHREGETVEKTSLTKIVFHPFKYPVESFMLQQGACGVGYTAAGINWGAVSSGDISGVVETSGLVIQGLLCIAAPVVQNILKERDGWLHPRAIASACLFASSVVLAWAAYQTGSPLLGAASASFMTSNVLTGIARRQPAALSHG